MARYAIIIDGVVANVAEAEPDFASAQGWVDAQNAGIGWTWGGETFTPPPPPPPVVPASVTARQAVQALILAGIDEEDVEAAIAAMTDPVERKLARNFWLRSNEFERANPYLNTLAGALGLDDAALDSLFITAAGL